MSKPILRRIQANELPDQDRMAVKTKTLVETMPIVQDVRKRGETALIEYAMRFGDIKQGDQIYYTPNDLNAALDSLDDNTRALLHRTADRIRAFAKAQLGTIGDMTFDIPGGQAGQQVAPVERAGCYAPGGRFPLPSSVLMTAITARVAGVKDVWVASPCPSNETLAAAAIAGADGLLAIGGAQAIAAMAYGAGKVPACDIIVGPGNRYVTAAKKLIAGQVGIDMLAGPSELVVLADKTADPQIIAADLLAQAEHDPDALPILLAIDGLDLDAVDNALQDQLVDLPTAQNAGGALANGFAVVVSSVEEGIAICDRLAPEHLEVFLENPGQYKNRFAHFGSLFLGQKSAEVFADYGAGPNHVLPTGGTARITGGLSVFDFLRIRTWLRIDDTQKACALVDDSKALAEIEGLAGHASSAQSRKGK